MSHYDRYLRRTFYYFDETTNDNETIRVSWKEKRRSICFCFSLSFEFEVSFLCRKSIYSFDTLSNGRTTVDQSNTKTWRISSILSHVESNLIVSSTERIDQINRIRWRKSFVFDLGRFTIIDRHDSSTMSTSFWSIRWFHRFDRLFTSNRWRQTFRSYSFSFKRHRSTIQRVHQVKSRDGMRKFVWIRDEFLLFHRSGSKKQWRSLLNDIWLSPRSISMIRSDFYWKHFSICFSFDLERMNFVWFVGNSKKNFEWMIINLSTKMMIELNKRYLFVRTIENVTNKSLTMWWRKSTK